MANEIKDLKGFMEAVENESNSCSFEERTSVQHHDLLLLQYTMRMIIGGYINEKEYIEKWRDYEKSKMPRM